MTEDLDYLLDDTEKPEFDGKRPPFLTVLCILTFVGTGLSLLYGLFQIFSYSLLESAVDDLGNISGDDMFGNYYRWMKISILVSFVAALLRLSGAIVMWKLKRVGFYLYIVGQGAPLIVSLLSLGSSFIGLMSFGVIGLAVNAAITIGFVVMYGLNYKYLK